jgi:hemerythrin-like domain-containing protein
MKSTKLLMADHEIILRALLVLDEMVMETEHGKEINNDDIRSLLTFFRDFADGCHHVKEEAIFFPALMQASRAFQDGPLSIIGYEHKHGRALTSTMSESLDRDKKEDFLMYAHRYIDLMTEHMDKENDVLFDIANQTLSDEEDDKVADDFERFGKTTIGMQTQECAHDMIESLASKYLQAVA